MYTVIGHPKSRTMRVLWALEELGEPYDLTIATPHSEVALKHNPAGKIPSLLVEGQVLVDSIAIMQFLADRHGALTHPAGSLLRARQDAITQFAVEEVDGALWSNSKHSFYLPENLRLEPVKELARREFDRAMVTLERHLGENEFVMGDMFSVPDIILGHCAGWAKGNDWAIPGGHITAYFARIRTRPALVQAMEKAALAAKPV